MLQLATQFFQATRQNSGVSSNAFSNTTQTYWAVIHRIHAGNNCWQNLRCTNIRGGFFTTNMLFACLQCEPVRRVAMRVNADANQATGHGAFVFVFARQIRCVRTTSTHRHTKTLGIAHHNVRAQFTGRREQGQSQKISRHDDQTTFGLVCADQLLVRRNFAIHPRVLQ